ncbi:MAG TPA: Trm112 family protein [Gammaproteobacteria bacterium]|nr:Trm112 family protein [Gammaproteobacteria bacterium]
MDPKLLEILCCPVSKQPVFPLSKEKLAAVNTAIAAGHVTQANDTVVETPLGEGLITKNKQRIYRIDDGIPVMLEEESIAVDQIEGL